VEDKMNESYKTRKELLEKKLMGEKDYQMIDNNWSDRYEFLYRISQDGLINIIYELDRIKGTRITILYKNTGKIVEEIK
jgi:hypothetical protein